jgi:hypothetical protein
MAFVVGKHFFFNVIAMEVFLVGHQSRAKGIWQNR